MANKTAVNLVNPERLNIYSSDHKLCSLCLWLEKVDMEGMENFTRPHSSANLTVFRFWKTGIVEMSMFTFSFISGLPTHAYVLWLILTGTGSGVASEFFHLNLSVCGIVFSVNSLLSLCINWFPFPSLTALSNFLFGFAMTGRPLFQCLISVERYLAVVHPVTFLKFKPLRYRVICSVIVWLANIVSCGVNVTTFLLLYSELFSVFLLAQFIIYLFIQLFCCLAVLRALKQSGPGDRGKEKEEENHMKRRAFYLILITTVSMTITHVPFTITVFLFFVKQISIQILWSISYMCFMLTGLVLPVLFLHRTGKLTCWKTLSFQ